ncbi:MAG TPA: FAD-linked oxidase C-terminal domain-containing protein [Acidimicrobiales bacterium]|nr:FAD-linked oxidase C-terminal domain-containing protein [Acidimicrobiales bacterium]
MSDDTRAALLADLRAALSDDRVRAEPHELELYGHDASIADGGDAAVVCFPLTTAEVQACVRLARHHGRPFTARGAGTGLAGGAVPLGGPVVIVTTKMNRVVSIDPDERVAWVEPGVINLDLTRALAPFGLHFAPDPSSQQACSIGGNVANNSGGPHCLAYGVTSAHVLAIEAVLPDGSSATLGGLEPEPAGYDLRGLFVGSEGTLGIATRVAVRLTPDPPALRTLLVDFASMDDAAECVSAIIAAGLVPAALEMMAGDMIDAVEAFVHAGYPTDAAAVLLVEVDGLPAFVDDAVERIRSISRAHGARTVRVAADEAERQLLWKGRKSAFGAVSRIAPDYYLHDTVVPRTRLVEVLRRVDEIAAARGLRVLNVFHAGDGNLHPLLSFDAREPGVLEQVLAAGEEIVLASIEAGGVLSGEHGIGIEKRDLMGRMFSSDDLDAQARVHEVFDPEGAANPGKVLPAGSRCGELARIPEGLWV